MNAITRISIASALSMMSILACAATPDITGTYNCSGVDPSTNPPPFTEKMVIKANPSNPSVYNIQLMALTSVLPYNLATAMLDQGSGGFGFIYWNVKDPTSFGSEFFIIKPNGALDGVFAGSNKSVSGTETCTKTA